jgi:transcriptional regulator with XRE-family HTH domain
MAANERLRAAIPRAKKTVADVARVAKVDQKTVYRWLSNAERVPHPRTRFAVAKFLGEDEEWLWPAASTQILTDDQGPIGEIVGSYATRSDVPTALWWDLLNRATKQIDFLGYTLYFLGLQHPQLIATLKAKCADGCNIRAAIGHPDSPHIAYRDQEEGTPLTLPIRIRTTLTTWADILSCPGFQLRFQNVPLYNSVFRFDDEMFVTPHLFATVGSQAPLFHLRRLGAGGLFDRFASHFDGVWNASVPSQNGEIPQLAGASNGQN